MTTTSSLPSSAEDLDTLFTTAIDEAIAGELSAEKRVTLYRVAMAVAAKEFHRIEATAGGTVAAEVLATLQHITHICDYAPAKADEDGSEDQDSGGGLSVVS
jgi:hypothetical protein